MVAPPDGAMGDYMASLTSSRGRNEQIYLPGHGGAVQDAPRFVAAYILHRKAREAVDPAPARKGRKPTSRLWCARSISASIRGSKGPPACQCWRTWKTWWRAARSRPTVRPRSHGGYRLLAEFFAGLGSVGFGLLGRRFLLPASRRSATTSSISSSRLLMREALAPKSCLP